MPADTGRDERMHAVCRAPHWTEQSCVSVMPWITCDSSLAFSTAMLSPLYSRHTQSRYRPPFAPSCVSAYLRGDAWVIYDFKTGGRVEFVRSDLISTLITPITSITRLPRLPITDYQLPHRTQGVDMRRSGVNHTKTNARRPHGFSGF